MITMKCDNCNHQITLDKSNTKNGIPEGWISIYGKVINNNKYNRLVKSDGHIDFCSRECLEEYFFAIMSENQVWELFKFFCYGRHIESKRETWAEFDQFFRCIYDANDYKDILIRTKGKFFKEY